MDAVEYLVLDIETVGDGDLIRRVRYPDEPISPAEAVQKFRSELASERRDGKDILPYTFVLPISVVVAKLDSNFRLIDLTALDSPVYRPAVMVKKFWSGWEHYGKPTLITFNGRTYDLPVLELAGFRYGLSLPGWFQSEDKSFTQPRNRYNQLSHLDLMDLMTNFGASRLMGGLNLLANLIGKPGKTTIDGSQVQGLYDAGELEQINNYCRCDVLDTYFVFLRSRVLLGKLKLEEEHQLVLETKHWLEERAELNVAYRDYLANWGDWVSPEV